MRKHIPVALKYIILQYIQGVIGCPLLSIKEDLKFFKLITTKIKSKIRVFNVLYKASNHNYCHNKFHELYDAPSSTTTIIQSNHGSIFATTVLVNG